MQALYLFIFLHLSFGFQLNTYLDPITYSKPSTFNVLKDKYFPIGSLFPLKVNFSNALSTEGVQETFAFICGISRVNENKTLLPDTTLTYQIRDPLDIQEAAVSGSISLQLFENVILVFGTGSSFQSAITLQFISNYEMGYVDFTAPNSIIESPYYIRFNPPTIDITQAVIQLLKSMNWTLISAIYGDYLYGVEVKNQFSNLAFDNNITIVCSEILSTRNTDFRISIVEIDYIENCLAALPHEVNVMVLFSSTSTTLFILEQLYQNPNLNDFTFVLATTSFINLFNAFPASYLTPLPAYAYEVPNPQVFQSCYKSIDSSILSQDILVPYRQVVFRCINQLPPYTDKLPTCNIPIHDRIFPPECLCQGNETLDAIPISAISSLIVDAVEIVAITLQDIISQCSSSEEGHPFNCSALTGKDFLTQLRSHSYANSFGTYNFAGGYSPINRPLTYVQFVGDPIETEVGTFINGTAFINYSSMKFKTGSIPISAIVPESISFEYIGGIIMSCIAIFLIAIAIVFIFLIWYFKGEPPIKKSSPLFCTLILLGVCSCLCTIICKTFYPTTITCALWLWFLFIGFGLILGKWKGNIIGSILAKTYRIYQIFSAHRVGQVVVSDRDLLFFTGAIILCISVLLIITTALTYQPPIVEYSPYSPLISFYVCYDDEDPVSDIPIYLLVAFIAGLLLVLSIVTYLTRNVDSAFNESLYIAITIYTYLAIIILIVPMYIITFNYLNSLHARYMEISIGILVTMTVTLCALFLPKFSIIYKSYNARSYDIFEDSEEDRSLISDDSGDSTSLLEPATRSPSMQFLTQELW